MFQVIGKTDDGIVEHLCEQCSDDVFWSVEASVDFGVDMVNTCEPVKKKVESWVKMSLVDREQKQRVGKTRDLEKGVDPRGFGQLRVARFEEFDFF